MRTGEDGCVSGGVQMCAASRSSIWRSVNLPSAESWNVAWMTPLDRSQRVDPASNVNWGWAQTGANARQASQVKRNLRNPLLINSILRNELRLGDRGGAARILFA